MFFRKKENSQVNEKLINDAIEVFEKDEQDFRSDFKSIDFVRFCERLQRIPDLDFTSFGWTLSHYLDSLDRKHVLFVRCQFNSFDDAFNLYRKIVNKVVKPINYKVDV